MDITKLFKEHGVETALDDVLKLILDSGLDKALIHVKHEKIKLSEYLVKNWLFTSSLSVAFKVNRYSPYVTEIIFTVLRNKIGPCGTLDCVLLTKHDVKVIKR